MSEVWKDQSKTFEERAKDLVGQMTVEEKISQMVYNAGEIERLGIPSYNWWNECLHGVARAGVATVFPQSIGIAASFNKELMYEVATAISDEVRAKHHEAKRRGDFGIYKGLTMWSPNVNIFRDPRWGRGHETYGEDPFLTAEMGVAFCKGLQGDDDKYLKTVATAKHYAVHSGPEADRHHFDAVVSEKDLRETYLPAFEACIKEAGAYSVMGAYNRTNGEACCASETLLQKILRDEWGFEGYVVSDCGAIEDIHKHHKLVETPAESSALAVTNGCDLNCGYVYPHLVEAVKQGLIDEKTLNKAIYRLMLARFKLGMFDDDKDVPYASISIDVNDCEAHHELNKKMARQTFVMLKNDGLLPVSRDKVKTIAVIGPNGDNRDALIGNYFGRPSVSYTVVDGMRAAHPEAEVLVAEGCTLTEPSREASWGESPKWGFSEAASVADRADLVVLVLGMTAEVEGEEAGNTVEGGDKENIILPGMQQELLDYVVSLNKPTVLLNMTGSCVDLRSAQNGLNAVIQCWYPGQYGGLLAAEAVFGDFSPSGRLPITFYNDMSEIPPFENYSMENRTYKYFEGTPLYPFGYGLTYSDIVYSDLKTADEIGADDSIKIEFTLENKGSYDVSEAVQVYITDEKASVAVPKRKLCAIKKVDIKAGEKMNIQMEIPSKATSLIDNDGKEKTEAGEFTLYVSGGQPDERTQELTGKKPLKTVFSVNSTK